MTPQAHCCRFGDRPPAPCTYPRWPPFSRRNAAMSRWAHPLVRPELGCLVIAKEGMFTQQQQYFYKAVALVIQHGDDGTVALILNRPTTLTMGDVCTGNLQRVPGMEDNVRKPVIEFVRSRA